MVSFEMCKNTYISRNGNPMTLKNFMKLHTQAHRFYRDD